MLQQPKYEAYILIEFVFESFWHLFGCIRRIKLQKNNEYKTASWLSIDTIHLIPVHLVIELHRIQKQSNKSI